MENNRDDHLAYSPSNSCIMFAYGTLMHPKIFLKVTNNDGTHLELAPAILHSYVRHQVKYQSYPVIIPAEQSRTFLNTNLSEEQCCVKGAIIRGLSAHDMARIENFEGNLYRRIKVKVKLIRDFIQLDDMTTNGFIDELKTLQDRSFPIDDGMSTVDAYTYLWDRPFKDLSPDLWSFEEFLSNKLSVWL